ncbi:WD-40 repeat protein [Salpingoeca rosetta]|uniref:WD-40 repeat protein n=1 Tax=Salpingoeca rosetta (strain ATCC 50818 / BSB-021) TaxID=946362 RepID=F2UJ94_SALR5|nr:WD-40 repeat protein [Salpingoeca rosetta]EGD77193.1 WD-40 repeat protein [Salpingoeca rosetta]|eukprot:XP_004990537.1 WD-40 repeat protein [Salpingoeca rosetta]
MEAVFEGHTKWVRCVYASADGRHVYSGSRDDVIRIWDLQTHACVAQLEGHISDVNAISETRDGWYVVSGCGVVMTFALNRGLAANAIKVWSTATRECVATLEGHSNFVSSITITPDDKHIISSSRDNTIRIWSLDTFKCECVIEDAHAKGVGCVCITDDGTRVISGGGDYAVNVWRLVTSPSSSSSSSSSTATARSSTSATLSRIASMGGHTAYVNGLCLAASGSLIVSASGDKTLRLWKLPPQAGNNSSTAPTKKSQQQQQQTKEGARHLVGTLTGHRSAVTAVAVVPNAQNNVVSVSDDTTVKVWCLETRTCLATLLGHTSTVFCVSVTRDSEHIVTGSDDNTVRVWRAPFEALETVRLAPQDALALATKGVFTHVDVPEIQRVLQPGVLSLIASDPPRAIRLAIKGLLPYVGEPAVQAHLLPHVLDLIAEDPPAAIALAQSGKLPYASVPEVQTSLFQAAIGSDISLAVEIANDVLTLPPANTFRTYVPRARLRPGDFIVVDAGLLLRRAEFEAYVETHERRDATLVRTQVLDLDMRALCGARRRWRWWWWSLIVGDEAAASRKGSRLSENAHMDGGTAGYHHVHTSHVAVGSSSDSTSGANGGHDNSASTATTSFASSPPSAPQAAWGDGTTNTNSSSSNTNANSSSNTSSNSSSNAQGADLASSRAPLVPAVGTTANTNGTAAFSSIPQTGAAVAGGTGEPASTSVPMPPPVPSSSSSAPSSSLFSSLVASGRAELFQYLPLRAAVQLRWQCGGRFAFVLEATLHVIMLALLVFVSVSTHQWPASLDVPSSSSSSSGSQTMSTTTTTMTTTTAATSTSASGLGGGSTDDGTVAMQSVVLAILVLAAISGADEAYQLSHRAATHFSSLWNWLDLARTSMTLAFGVLYLQESRAARTVLAFTVVLQWIGLLYFLLPFQRTGPLVLMLLQILRDTYVFLAVLLVVVLGATNSLYVFLHDAGGGGFTDVAQALFTTTTMLLFGGYDDSLFTSASDNLSLRVVFIAVMFLVLVILLNLLIAILSDSYERIQDRSAMELTMAKAKILDDQEASLFLWLRRVMAAAFGIVAFAVFVVVNVLTLGRFEQRLAGAVGEYVGTATPAPRTPPLPTMATSTTTTSTLHGSTQQQQRRYRHRQRQVVECKGTRDVAKLLLITQPLRVGAWPERGAVLIPEHASQLAEDQAVWQGMLRDIKGRVGQAEERMGARVEELAKIVDKHVGDTQRSMKDVRAALAQLDAKLNRLLAD